MSSAHVLVSLSPAMDVAPLLTAPQASFPLILTFGQESFSAAIASEPPSQIPIGSSASVALKFLVPPAALLLATAGARFSFWFPPAGEGGGKVKGHGKVLQVFGA
jgi:hypothetical protein